MNFSQELKTEQRLNLTQAMRQHLKILQLPVHELSAYLVELSMSNPMLEAETAAPAGSFSVESIAQKEADSALYEEYSSINDNDSERQMIAASVRIDNSYTDLFGSSLAPHGSMADAADNMDYSARLSRTQTFSEYLHRQLGLRANIEEPFLSLTGYLIDCLNSSGYLDIPLSELAEDLNVPEEYMEEALFTLQSLDPSGVGARSLSECLLLQLAEPAVPEGMDMGTIVKLIMTALPILASHDMKTLAKALNISREDAAKAAAFISSLNPIPSRGFYQASDAAITEPDAYIYVNDGSLSVELNERALPRIGIDSFYSSILREGTSDSETAGYLKARFREANEVITGVKNRFTTLGRVIEALVRHQQAYFLSGSDLLPLTRSDLAEELNLSSSTVSRSVKDKYLQFKGRVMPLDTFFTNAVGIDSMQLVSSRAVKEQIKRIVAAEDKTAPLSDEAIKNRLSDMGIDISRRTAAKYRAELKIPSKAERKLPEC